MNLNYVKMNHQTMRMSVKDIVMQLSVVSSVLQVWTDLTSCLTSPYNANIKETQINVPLDVLGFVGYQNVVTMQ